MQPQLRETAIPHPDKPDRTFWSPEISRRRQSEEVVAALATLTSAALVVLFPIAGTAGGVLVTGAVGALARARKSRSLWLIAALAAAVTIAGLVICLFFLAGPSSSIQVRVGSVATVRS